MWGWEEKLVVSKGQKGSDQPKVSVAASEGGVAASEPGEGRGRDSQGCGHEHLPS